MTENIINVLMTGGLRCGKTSVLAAMQACLESLIGTTGLTISPATTTALDKLEEKFQKNRDIFKDREKKSAGFTPDDAPSNDIQEYKFQMYMDGKKTDLCINFYDYPGEFIKDNIHNDQIKKLFAISRIIVIAIDTPHMLEEEQRFDDRRNLERRIFEYIKSSEFLAPGRGPALVLFVPLKCEKYYAEKRMDEVARQLMKSYNPLITFLKETSRQNNIPLTMAITPILTLGGVSFSHFEKDEDGEIKIIKKYKLPEKPIYIFPDLSKSAPEPMYCEQPLLQILKFSLNEDLKQKEKRSILKKFISFIKFIFSSFLWLIALIVSGILFFRAPVFALIALLIFSYFLLYLPLKRANKKRRLLRLLTDKIKSIQGKIKSSGDGYTRLA